MSARKRSGSRPRATKESLVEPELPLEELFADNVDVAQIDLLEDLNEDFFATSYQLVQHLSTRDNFVAGKIKRYVDILARIHARYVSEVESGVAMRQKVANSDEKLDLALKATAISESMMEKLREALTDSWRTTDAVKHREALMQGQLLTLAKSGPRHTKSDTQDDRISQQETRIRGMVYRERDRVAGELKDYQKRLELYRIYSETLDSVIQSLRDTVSGQQMRIKVLEAEGYKAQHKHRKDIEIYEERVMLMRKELDAAQQSLRALKLSEKEKLEVMAMNERLKLANEHLSRENYTVSRTFHHKQEEKNRLVLNLKISEDMNSALRRDNDDLEAYRRNIDRELKKKVDDAVLLERRFIQLSKKNSDLSDQIIVKDNEIRALEKKQAMTMAKLEEVTHQKDDIVRTRGKLQLEIVRVNDVAAGLRHGIAALRTQIQDVNMDLTRVNKKLDEKELDVHRIAREKREVAVELNEAQKKIEKIEESLHIKTERLELIQEELQRKHQDFMDAKKQMEIAHSERVMLLKTMDMCSRDRQILQSTVSRLTHQINQLSSTVAMNEKDISSLHKDIDQLNSTIKQKQNEIHAKERLLASTRDDLHEMKIRFEQSQHTIDEDEKRFKHISCTLEEVSKEKSLVGLQMVRRNDEVRLLREKETIMQTALDRGTSQYNQRLEDIRLLKMEIVNLRMSHQCMQREVGNRATMRQDVVRLERQLLQERLRISACTAEMAIPLRIHRWRVMIGKDPRRYELIRKIQALLKRNIRLNVQLQNMSMQLQDSVRLYDTLKARIKHLPDPSVREKLCTQQRINRRQQNKLRAFKAELIINEIDLKSRDCLLKECQRLQQPNQSEANIAAEHKRRLDKYTEQYYHENSSASGYGFCKKRKVSLSS
ncbi:cilia- and flagella-associated protein 58 [Drosophila guanche]|uniref:Blast:Coiled-coil domain-containing protein 147 n=1 Tax=Drosophila guanche TaxID=7266 RepID=A0A3B0JYH8_DROGU|nr:cilia- and flagella-associated protein 58 [Drosophila guanche]SPP80570.1 blast:Coiled-coil domain-containing protein 147 [Drosophila guanche]